MPSRPLPQRPRRSARAPHLPYFPALDGVRGLAVAGVLLFHAGFSWMVGGYLGVSTFFTLSGFLITSLLLAERAANGGVSLKAFWMRRFRRLMPAALARLILALLFGVFVADAIQRKQPRRRRDRVAGVRRELALHLHGHRRTPICSRG